MAVKKNATKTSKRAQSGLEKVTLTEKETKQIKKRAKKVSVKAWLFAILFLILGVAGGAGAWWIVCRNDCFELAGEEEICLTTDEKYVDDGVKIIAFGKDFSTDFTIETNLKIDSDGKYYSDEVGTFYIKYKSQNFKYKTLFKVEKVRLVTFVEPSEDVESEVI